jgi:hypothetical protein
MAKKTAKPETKVIFVRLPLDLHDWIEARAVKEKRNLSNMVAFLLYKAQSEGAK